MCDPEAKLKNALADSLDIMRSLVPNVMDGKLGPAFALVPPGTPGYANNPGRDWVVLLDVTVNADPSAPKAVQDPDGVFVQFQSAAFALRDIEVRNFSPQQLKARCEVEVRNALARLVPLHLYEQTPLPLGAVQA